MGLGRWLREKLPDYMVYTADKQPPAAPPQETCADYFRAQLPVQETVALGEIALTRSVSPDDIPVMPIELPQEDFRQYEQ